jgi:hypothetical protein
MRTAKKSGIEAEKLELYDKVIATNPKVERKGAANAYTSLNGHMFSLLLPARSLALRLPEDARGEFLKKYKTTLFESYGAVMKEYVTVPDTLLGKTKELRKYFQLSYEYVETLKPKPNAKKKS